MTRHQSRNGEPREKVRGTGAEGGSAAAVKQPHQSYCFQRSRVQPCLRHGRVRRPGKACARIVYSPRLLRLGSTTSRVTFP